MDEAPNPPVTALCSRSLAWRVGSLVMAGWLTGARLVLAVPPTGTAPASGGPSTTAKPPAEQAPATTKAAPGAEAPDTLAPSTPPSTAVAKEVSPVGLIAELEKAWGAADVDGVLARVSRETVELALEKCGGPPSGRFARAQAEFLIRDLLHYGETIEFRVVAFEWKEEGPQARAKWTHRMGSGETSADLDIALAHEAAGWCVVRIAAR